MRPTLLLWLLASLTVYGQKADSVRVSYGTETVPTDSPNRQEPLRRARVLYRRFVRAQIEEKTLITVAGLPYFIGSSPSSSTWGFTSQVGVEQKLTPAWSVLAAAITRYRGESDFADRATIRALLGARWYYSMKRRMAAGKSANNFSSQYLAFEAGLPVWNGTTFRGDPSSRSVKSYPDPFTTPDRPAVFVGIGLQRRLGRFGYFDLSGGFARKLNTNSTTSLSVNFSIGFGL
ncbi:hypothetical protein [Fibrella aquatilis]|uniref:Uncharacterized protein n=1 Tax=Fibrella aquatilis TaxID=2817059 RepID=A0A939JZ69_9BACT|nr:hypothetical protein [Fibrella aquatilis]MBO0932829.1 hypothetical protein [Fibrella aquatilis]